MRMRRAPSSGSESTPCVGSTASGRSPGAKSTWMRASCSSRTSPTSSKGRAMASKFKVGDKVIVPQDMQEARSWWRGKHATVRAVFEETSMYEVLFDDAEDFAFIEERMLVPGSAAG